MSVYPPPTGITTPIPNATPYAQGSSSYLTQAKADQLYNRKGGTFTGTSLTLTGTETDYGSTTIGTKRCYDLIASAGATVGAGSITAYGALTCGTNAATCGVINGNTYSYNYVSSTESPPVYYKIATLPAVSGGTYDSIHIILSLGGWSGTDRMVYDIWYSARAGRYMYTIQGSSNNSYNVKVYQYTSSTSDLYIENVSGGGTIEFSYLIVESMQATIYTPPLKSNSAYVGGSVVFSTATSDIATYPPMTFHDYNNAWTAMYFPLNVMSTFTCGTNAATCGALSSGAITSSGAFTCGTNAATCGALSTTTINAGTNSATCGSVNFTGLSTGAGAGAGTLTNAPSVGNPNFWLPIKIAGTTRYIPCW